MAIKRLSCVGLLLVFTSSGLSAGSIDDALLEFATPPSPLSAATATAVRSNPACFERVSALSPPIGNPLQIATATAPGRIAFGEWANGSTGTPGAISLFDTYDGVVPPRLLGTYTPPFNLIPYFMTFHDSLLLVANYGQFGGSTENLLIFDTSRPQAPALVGSLGLPGGPGRNLATNGKYVYMAYADRVGSCAGRNYFLGVIDISTPSRPALAGSFDVAGEPDSCGYPYRVAVKDTTVYVASGSFGLRVIDVTNPARPSEVGSVGGVATDVQVVGSTAVVAGDSLRVFDVRQPRSPVLLASLPSPSGRRLDEVRIWNNIVVMEEGQNAWFVDIREPSRPAVASNLPAAVGQLSIASGFLFLEESAKKLEVRSICGCLAACAGSCGDLKAQWPVHLGADVVLRGNRMYVAKGSDGIEVVDITDVSHPVQLAVTPGQADALAVFGNRLASTYSAAGGPLQTFTFQADGTLTPETTLPGNGWRTVAAIDAKTLLIGGAQTGLKVIEVPQGGPAKVIASLGSETGARVVYDQATRRAWLLVEPWFLYSYDLSNPKKPKKLGEVALAAPTGRARVTALSLLGSRLVATLGPAGLVVVDGSKPKTPKKIGEFFLDDGAYGLAVQGSRAYVGGHGGVTHVFDMAQADFPAKKGLIETGSADVLRVAGDHVFALSSPPLDTRPGFEGVTIAATATCGPCMNRVATVPLPVNREPYSLAFVNSRTLVAGGDGEIRVFDLTAPAQPSQAGIAKVPGQFVDDFATSGTVGFFPARAQGVRVVDVSTPSRPRIVGTIATRWPALRVDLRGSTLAVAGGGVQVFDVSNPAAAKLLAEYPDPNVTDAVVLASGFAITSGKELVILERQGAVLVEKSRVAVPGGTASLTSWTTTTPLPKEWVAVVSFTCGTLTVDTTNHLAPLVGSWLTSARAAGKGNGEDILPLPKGGLLTSCLYGGVFLSAGGDLVAREVSGVDEDTSYASIRSAAVDRGLLVIGRRSASPWYPSAALEVWDIGQCPVH